MPITGGRFAGPQIKGVVLSGGADRQLVRADGATLLDALYEMQTDDGAVVTVSNRALINQTAGRLRLRLLSAHPHRALGPHAWLNHLVFVGDLHFDPAQPQSVLIRVYSLT